MRLNLDEFKSQVKIVPNESSKKYRAEYIEKFVNTDCEHYKKYINTLREFSDGMCYTGHLWDCLIEHSAIKVEDIYKYRGILDEVLVFWDIHSKDRIWIEDYWKFSKDSMLKLKFETLIDNLDYLPEDIYVFDELIEWTLILTHEDINGERLCEQSGEFKF